MPRVKLLLSAVVLGVLIFASLETATAVEVLRVPKDFVTIQDAVDASAPGDIIQVDSGTYQESVLITTPGIRLHGRNATLDGTTLDGIGVHVLNTSDIHIQGFIVEGFEVGIALENTDHSQLHLNELRENFSDTPTLRDGIQLINAHDNQVTNNHAHGNGHNGITLKGGSSHNTLRGNSSNDNGVQVAANFGGCGIQLIASGNDENLIAENETLRNGWGIQIGGGSNENVVAQNRSHQNARAGVVVLDPGNNNFIGQNNADDNGLADVAPSGLFDLFDQGALDNFWENNLGTSNF
jgi:parallel beta-helix repeat protein